MTVQLPTSCSVCFCTTKGIQTKRNMRGNTQKRKKNILDIIDHNLKKHHQILVILGLNVSDTTGY